MKNLDSYSPEIKSQIKIVLEMIVNFLELKDFTDKFALKIPLSRFTEKQIHYQQVIAISKLLSNKNNLFEVLNEKLKRLLREEGRLMLTDKTELWNSKVNELKNAYYKLGVTEEDLQEYLLLQINNANCIQKLGLISKQLSHSQETQGESEVIRWPSDWGWSDDNTYRFGGKGSIKFMPKKDNKTRRYFEVLVNIKDWVELKYMKEGTGESHEQIKIKLNQIREKIFKAKLDENVALEAKGKYPGAYRLKSLS